MQDLAKGWGEAIEEALNGRSHRWLAQQVGVHPTTIDRIIKGELDPNNELKFKIAGVLQQRMDVLWAWPKIVPPMPMAVA